MAWGPRKANSSGKAGIKDKNAKGTYNIPKYMLFPKHALAPYPNESSNPLYSGDLEAEEFLEFKSIAKSRTPSNCEFLRRPGMATSLAASALRVGAEELAKGSLGGLDSMIKFAKSKKDFVKCLKVLDTGKTKQPDKKSIERATSAFVDTLQNLDAEERQSLSDLALASARLYLFAMNALEAADMLGNPKMYARKLEKTPDGRKCFSDFIKSPSDPKQLKAMLVRCLLEKIKKHKQNKKEAAAKDVSDDDSASDEDSAKSSAAPSSSSSRKDSGKGKKRKTTAKDSSEGGEKKTKKAKTKKTTKAKKTSHSHDGSSSNNVKEDKKKTKKSKASKKAKRTSSGSGSSESGKDGKDETRRGRGAESSASSSRKPGSKKDKKRPAWTAVMKEVDEGQSLEVNEVTYNNCCLALALGRAIAGEAATRAEARSWASTWLAGLPDALRDRIRSNEAELGEMLFDDYLETVTQADERAVVFLVADDPPATRVWAGSAATWDEMRPHGLRLSGRHFTALFAKEGTIREALPQLPPVEMFSYVGPAGQSGGLHQTACNNVIVS